MNGSVAINSRTLYKPRDVENARRNIERYPWAQQIVRDWEQAVAYATQRDRGFFEHLIPELTPGQHYGQNCPACVGVHSTEGAEEFVLRWSISAPDRLTCSRCGTEYPNDAYPETGTLECPRMGQTFTYYQPPAERALGPLATPEERRKHAFMGLVPHRPQMTSLSGLIRFYRAQWAWRQTLPLAKLYAVTGEVACAERVAWILDRFSRVFPRYLYKTYTDSYADWPPAAVAAEMDNPATPPGGRFPPDAIRDAYGLSRQRDERGDYSTMYSGFWGSGRLEPHGKGSDSGPLLDMTVAYDLTRDARYPDGRPVYEGQAHRRIVADLIDAGCTDYDHWNDLSNKGVATRSLSAAVGLLLQQPERVRRALDGFDQILATRYHFDGFYSESPAYAAHNYGNMGELPDLLEGYSDPPGYQPEGGRRIDGLAPYAHGRFRLALLSMVRQLAPRNLLPVIGDTFPDTRINPLYAEVLAARLEGPYAGLLEAVMGTGLSEWGGEYSLWYRDPDLRAEAETRLPLRTEWFPGWHVGVLRGDPEANESALFLNGNEWNRTIHTGHRHNDILSLSYYAFGEELASDRGYVVTPDGRRRCWATGTLSHNLVVVDEQDQSGYSVVGERRPCGSNLELFGVAPGIEVVQASAVEAYPQCEDYRRTCAMIRIPGGRHYVVDLFRVSGGRIHQYAFHCNGSLKGMTPIHPASCPVELSGMWSSWLQSPRAVVPEAPCVFTWKRNDVNLDLTVLNTDSTIDRIIVADAPGWRCCSEALEGRPPIQQILAESRAAEGVEALTTQYAAVAAAYRGDASPVLSARMLENDCETGAMAVEVRLAGRTDYLLSARDRRHRQVGPVGAAGELAFVSVDDAGNVVQAYLLAGTRLQCGDMDITLPEATPTLRVASVSDRTIHLERPAPGGLAARGAYLLARGPAPGDAQTPTTLPVTGFEIESTCGKTITVRDYPVFECSEVTLLNSKWIES
ncbi:MAG: hypothetical protein EXS64_03645 [Candidatus Latescibacteria bacterium]|nr:hypothetical protein [Candidatus Latescibacterota bacterium]